MNINYIRMGDYYIPDLTLPEEPRPMGKWGRMHREYLREHKPIQYNCLLLSAKLWTYLADLNEQSQTRLTPVIEQMKAAEGITEALKASDPMAWVQRMNNIRARAEETVREELSLYEHGRISPCTGKPCGIPQAESRRRRIYLVSALRGIQ